MQSDACYWSCRRLAKQALEVSLCHAQSFGRSAGIMQIAYEAGILIDQREELV
jgi:hypothetical protein